jgi:C-terminal processing protease CtpA/Prc
MNFYSIVDGLSTVSRFRKAVDAMFRLVASDKPRVLIIDLRENGGGEDSAATALLRHITEKPFRLLASTQVRRSQEVRDFVNSMIRVPFRWMRLFRDLLYQLHLEPGPAVD